MKGKGALLFECRFAALEHRRLGKGLVEVDRIVVARYLGKLDDVCFGHGLGVAGRLANREILDEVTRCDRHDVMFRSNVRAI